MIAIWTKPGHKAKPAPKKKKSAQGQPRRRAVPLWRTPGVLAGFAAAVLLAGMAGAWWTWRTGVAADMIETARWELIARSADLGFRVEVVQVTGRRQASREDVLAAVQITRGAPILAFDAEAARKRVEALPWVRAATIERRLPDAVFLHLIERRPIALWQDEGQFHLIDGDGEVILSEGIERFSGLLMVIGKNAPKELPAFFVLLESNPQLMARVRSATWVGGRRWNIRLEVGTPDGGDPSSPQAIIEVRLPEENAIEAWQRLSRYQDQNHIFDRDVSVIDMRLPDRITIRRRSGPITVLGKQET